MFVIAFLIEFLDLPGVVKIKLDQCEYGLRLPEAVVMGGIGPVVAGQTIDDVRVKNPTVLITNLPGAET